MGEKCKYLRSTPNGEEIPITTLTEQKLATLCVLQAPNVMMQGGLSGMPMMGGGMYGMMPYGMGRVSLMINVTNISVCYVVLLTRPSASCLQCGI